jgi:hypothetical protein
MSDTTQAPAAAQAVFEEGGSIVIDMSNTAAAKFENVPKGVYDFEIVACEFKNSKAGAPMWETWAQITTPGDYAGRKLPYYFSFSEKAVPFTKAALEKVAPEYANGKFDPAKVAADGALLGKVFKARVGWQTYEGTERHTISQILPPAGAGAAAPSGTKF